MATLSHTKDVSSERGGTQGSSSYQLRVHRLGAWISLLKISALILELYQTHTVMWVFHSRQTQKLKESRNP